MSKRGSNSELFVHENDALTARPQLHHFVIVIYDLNFLHTENSIQSNLYIAAGHIRF